MRDGRWRRRCAARSACDGWQGGCGAQVGDFSNSRADGRHALLGEEAPISRAVRALFRRTYGTRMLVSGRLGAEADRDRFRRPPEEFESLTKLPKSCGAGPRKRLGPAPGDGRDRLSTHRLPGWSMRRELSSSFIRPRDEVESESRRGKGVLSHLEFSAFRVGRDGRT